MLRRVQLGFLLGLGSLAVGCGSGGVGSTDDGGETENVGSITLDLTSVPTGVGCVRVAVTGSSVVTKDFTLAAGAATSALNVDRLPLGNIVVDGSAYTTTCGTGSPIYLADTASASIAAGVVTTLALTFRKNNPVTAIANFVGNVQAISAQYGSTYAVIDGVVYAWGHNWATGADVLLPTAVPGLTGVVDLSQGSGSGTPCAIKSDGSTWCWGDNSGNLAGVASPALVTTPVRVGTETGVTIVTQGGTHGCAAEPNNQLVKCWGQNGAGQFGNFTTTSPAGGTLTATRYESVKSLAAGSNYTCLITSSFSVYCTGYNASGQLGDGSATSRSSWGITALVGVPKSISAGLSSTCVALVDGTANCWGFNGDGEVGDGTFTNPRLSPVAVSGLAGVNKLSVGEYHVCALLDSRAVKCWGYNASGQLGDGTLTTRSSPVGVVEIPDPLVMLSAGAFHTCAVTSRQDIYCWGDNTKGALGDGSFNNAVKPVKVKLP